MLIQDVFFEIGCSAENLFLQKWQLYNFFFLKKMACSVLFQHLYFFKRQENSL